MAKHRVPSTDDASGEPPDRAARITLEVVAGPSRGRRYHFYSHDHFLVGRAECAHFRLPKSDRYFSRVHFMIEFNPPHCRLVDMGSSNGTYLNRKRVGRADLKDRDLIQGGQTAFRVRIRQAPQAAERASSGSGELAAQPPSPQERVKNEAAADKPVLPALPPAITPTLTLVAPLHAGRHDSLAGDLHSGRRNEAVAQLPGFQVPGYRLDKKLGGGGMGVVWLATREADGQTVAIKMVRPAMAAAESDLLRFVREASILQQLNHPNIVSFHEMGMADGRLFIAMEYVPGTDAAAMLRNEGPLTAPRAIHLACQLLDGLGYAHAKGFVHRDIKPSNLMLAGERGAERACLGDFGLARVYHDSPISGLTLMGDVAGTVPFMAPEQITNFRDAGPPADLYSTGASLYNLLTGRMVHDFEDCSAEQQLLKILLDPPIPLRQRSPDAPADLAAVVERSLQRDPARRFRDAASMRQALAALRCP